MKHTLPIRIAVPLAPPKSGIEHFYLMTTQPTASRYAVIATGCPPRATPRRCPADQIPPGPQVGVPGR